MPNLRDTSQPAEPSSKTQKVKATASRAFHATGDAAHALKGKAIQIIDDRRQRSGGEQRVLAAHAAAQREVVVVSKLVPDYLRIQHTSELALNMYKKHIGIENDYKGIYYCAYGNSGHLVGLSLGVDLVTLLLPALSLPFGLDVHAEISVNAKGGAINHLLLLIHRGFPKGLHMYDSTYQATDGQLVDQFTWQTVSPICFMALSGREKRFELGATIDTGASVGFPLINIDGHSLSLNLANLGAGIQGGGRFYKLNDRFPSWYQTVNHPALEIDFARFANPDKEILKGKINEWRKYLRDEVFLSLKTSANPDIKRFLDLLNQRLTLDISISGGVAVASSQQVLNWLNAIEWSFNDLSKKGLIALNPTDWNHFNTYLATARTTLPNAKWQADTAKTTGEKLPLKLNYERWTADQLRLANSRCKADITVWALGAQASAGVGGNASQEISLGQFFTANEATESAAIGAGLSLSAGTEIKGNARFMSSRYQTEAPNSRGTKLVFTQDSKVTYTQVVWPYSAGAAANLPFDFKIGYEKGRDKLLKNDMSYYSATAYWLTSAEPVNPYAIQTVPLEEGSGLNLGTSISLKALLDLRTNPGPAQIKRYPYHLGLSQSTFLSFINSIPATLFDPAYMAAHPYILIESSFRFIDRQSVQLDSKGAIEGLCKKFYAYGGRVSTRPRVALESIRCRVRLGSDLDQTRTAFKLGLHVAGIGPGIEIEKIERAGNMFIQDLYIWDAGIGASLVATPAGQPATGSVAGPAAGSPPPPDRDRKVPATVLLPHTFQID